MTTRKPKRATPAETFRDAVGACPPLRHQKGLQAIKKGEGKGQIAGQETGKILGSVDIDGDCLSDHPQSHRWDYVVGYDREGELVAHYVEVHSAETCEITTIENKLAWLLDFLRADGRRALGKLPREIHWVASGRINIPQHTPQFRKLQTTLRNRGLRGPVKMLVLG